MVKGFNKIQFTQILSSQKLYYYWRPIRDPLEFDMPHWRPIGDLWETIMPDQRPTGDQFTPSETDLPN